jgi:hypothetical protein
MSPRHLVLIFLSSRTIPVFTWQRNMTSYYLQTAARHHCSEFLVWELEHKDHCREDQAIYFSRSLRVSADVLQLNERDIPFVNNVSYLCVICDRRMTWRHHNERTLSKALSTYVRTHSLFRSGRLSGNIKLTLCKDLIGQLRLCLFHLGVWGGRSPL